MSAAVLAVVLAAAAGALAATGGRSRLEQMLARPGVGPGPTKRRVGVAMAVLGVGALAGPVAALLVLAGIVSSRRARRSQQRAADRRQERSRAADALSLLAAELRFGRLPADALQSASGVAVGPARRALAAAAESARRADDVGSALRADDSAVAATLRALAACWQVCSEAGGGLAAGVERLEESVRAAEEHRRAVEAELAGPRATAGLLALLPIGGIGLAASLGARPLHVLLHTAVGQTCLVAGLLLDGLGVWWTQRLVAGALDVSARPPRRRRRVQAREA